MTRRRWAAAGAVVLMVMVGAVAVAAGQRVLPLADAKVIVEVNATDGDAGLQIFLDGEPWRQVSVFRPNGERIAEFQATGPVGDYGLTELFSESSEPPFTEFPLEQFKALFPEGEYRFEATTISGERMAGSATLTHDIPNGPVITSPEEGRKLAHDRVEVRWDAGAQPEGVTIVGYQVVVSREDPLRVLSADLPATVTSFHVPPEFLERNVEYKVEVLAIDAGGNQTLTEISFGAK